MKNEKICFSKRVGFLVFGILILVLFGVFGSLALMNKNTTSTRAAPVHAVEKNKCDFINLRECLDSGCTTQNGTCTKTGCSGNLYMCSSSSESVKVLVWNQTKGQAQTLTNNTLITNESDVYQVCIGYSGNRTSDEIHSAYYIDEPSKSVFYVGIASSLISRNNSVSKIYGCTSVTKTKDEGVKQIQLTGSLAVGSKVPYTILHTPTLTIKAE